MLGSFWPPIRALPRLCTLSIRAQSFVVGINLARLIALLGQKRFRTIWILDRVTRPALAACLAGIPELKSSESMSAFGGRNGHRRAGPKMSIITLRRPASAQLFALQTNGRTYAPVTFSVAIKGLNLLVLQGEMLISLRF